MSGYEMVREKLFIYMTYVVINQKRYELKIVIYQKVGYLSTFFYVLSKQNGFVCLVLPQGKMFNSKLKLVKQQGKK